MNLIGQNIIDAEQAVIGAALLDNAVLDEIAPWLEPRDFSNSSHNVIWKGILHHWKQNKPVDMVILAEMLTIFKRVKDAGGIEYIASLINAVPSVANAVHYANLVRRAAVRRRGVEAGHKIIQLTEDNETDDEEYFATLEQIVTALRPNSREGMKHIGSRKDSYMKKLRTKDNMIMSGFTKFDAWMGGYGRGWLIVKAGRPSVGKTAKMLAEAVQIAKQGVGQVAIFSLEMSEEQLLNRMVSAQTAINANHVRQKKLDEKDFQKIDKALDYFSSLPLHIDDTPGVSIDYIRAECRKLRRQYGPIAAIYVDYLTIMDIPQQKGQTRAQAIGEVTKKAKMIAKEMDCPFHMLAQLSRESAKAGIKAKVEKPQLYHLKESGDIEQDADIVELLWIDADDTDSNGKVVQSFIAKGRDVGVSDFRFLFKSWNQTYQEL